MDTENSNMIVYRLSPAVNRFLLFLESCVEEGAVDTDELCPILNSTNPSEKSLLVLLLTACVQDNVLKEAFRLEENQGLFAGVLSTVGSRDCDLKQELYWEIIQAMKDINETLCLILANPSTSFSLQSMQVIVKMVEQGSSKKDLYLTLQTLSKILKMDLDSSEFGEGYLDCYKRLSSMAFSFKDESKYDKVVGLFRLLSGAVMDENEEDKMILKMAKEWDFLELEEQLPEASLETYKVLFKFIKVPDTTTAFIQRMVTVLQESFPLDSKEDLKVNDNENERMRIGAKTVTLLEYTSAFSHFVKLLMERRQLDSKDYPKLEKLFQFFLNYKPKLTDEEVINEDMSLEEFCKIVKIKKSDDDAELKNICIFKFLSYPMTRIMNSRDAHKATWILFRNADYDMVVLLLSAFSGEVKNNQEITVPLDWKKVLLDILMDSRWTSEERDRIIEALFADERFDLLQLKDEYWMVLNTVESQVSTIEKEENAGKLKEHEETITYLCFQNPRQTIWALLEQSIRVEVEDFKALQICQPFFAVKNINEKDTCNRSLLLDVHQKILKRLPSYPAAIFDSIGKSFPLLISKGYLTHSEIFTHLKEKITYLMQQDCICFNYVLGGIALLENFAKNTEPIDSILKAEIKEFALRLNRVFYSFTKSEIFEEAMQIREKLFSIKSHLQIQQDALIPLELPDEVLEEKEMLELGLLYIRCPEPKFRSQLKEVLEENFIELGFSHYFGFLTQWIINSCEPEWPDLIHLVFEFGYPLNPRTKRIRKIVVLNKALLAGYAITILPSGDMKRSGVDVFNHILKFYSSAIEYLKSNGDFIENDWIGLTNTLLSVGVALSEKLELKTTENQNSKKRISTPGIQIAVALYKVLNYLLKELEEYKNIWEEKPMKILTPNSLLEKMEKIKSWDPKCDSLVWVIKHEILKKMIPDSDPEIVA